MLCTISLTLFLGAVDLTVETMPGPAPAGSTTPALHRGEDGRVRLTWQEPLPDGHTRFAFATLAEKGWSEPLEIARGERFFVNWADVPGLVASSEGILLAHWLVSRPEGGYAYDAMFALSSDGGVSWSEPTAIHEDRSAAEHGFVSAVALDDDRFGVLWLDGRDQAEGGATGLYFRTVSADGELGAEQCIDDRVCDCCPTTLASDGHGGLLAAYRDRGDTEVRDIAFAHRDGTDWSEPAAAAVDGWVTHACPVNGPALVTDRKGGGALLRYTESGPDGGGLRVGWVADGGAFSDAALSIPSLGRVAGACLSDGAVLMGSLDRTSGGGAAWRLRLLEPNGGVAVPLELARVAAARSSGRLSLAPVVDGAVAAWVTTGGESAGVMTALVVPSTD